MKNPKVARANIWRIGSVRSSSNSQAMSHPSEQKNGSRFDDREKASSQDAMIIGYDGQSNLMSISALWGLISGN
jgi:hypothetical protein